MLEHIPDSENLEFKKNFIERYSKLTDFSEFRKYSLSFLRKSIRVNTIKASVAQIRESLGKRWKLTDVPWCPEGFWVESERRDIGNTLEHAMGYIYVQEAASMIPPIVLEPKPGEIVLDMCAAPGSKSTQIAQYMQNSGLLISNDNSYIRIKALAMNLQRCGVTNTVINNSEAKYFSYLPEFFDRILLDAPCSGTGTIAKSLDTIRMWNPSAITRLSHIQKNLIDSAFIALKPGGTLVYSTCTLEPEEDEGVIDFLLGKYDNAELCEISLNIKRSPAVLEFEGRKYNPEVKKCLRIWPQDNHTAGFFVAKIRKKES
ncbi:MAG: NOL1/NOP2/sun family putative RNA methylase [Candidatus Woesearchaeota archaeon]|nr:NOL1/NOP2/sun family putative RNA methylase [Candidatus Woesearchaeota archaeon]